MGANAGVSTEVPEVYAYVSSVVAFIGATVEGSVLSFDFDANRDFYGVSDPLHMEAKGIPVPALRFSCAEQKPPAPRRGFAGDPKARWNRRHLRDSFRHIVQIFQRRLETLDYRFERCMDVFFRANSYLTGLPYLYIHLLGLLQLLADH